MATLADTTSIPRTPTLPTYSSATDTPPTGETELAELSPSTSSSSLPPTYDDATASTSSAIVTTIRGPTDGSTISDSPPSPTTDSFTPTAQFQIETSGKQWFSLPTGTRPDPIPVFRVEYGSWSQYSQPVYTSLRFSRGDSSCHLVRDSDESQTPVCTTLYRFGPGKPPVFRLPKSPSPSSSGETSPGAAESEGVDLQIFSKSVTSRTQVLKTPYGTLRWRYASSKERAAVEGADELLVCELMEKVATKSFKMEEKTTRIAQLVRGEGTRTRGTGRSTAGNGGRLMMDLFRWTDLKGGGKEVVEGLVIASCICMLKKEVDRRRMQQFMVLGAGATIAI
ncbi:hypothetical protein CkaCkLH20_04078 [Colletotrichum karsti]|uniref:Uncharacterized protein n=1 Tax=Colletotrichum karsti TaxID=1095194 RepID=A0A9P6IDK1_9PEZI|nr:uncharacterized protein CkaCkLH20_04078 [Colletotrichum karsti]KAF9878586.1 hypothetical protein CkaCkLH20_04078 [Colletotrichum karsti]